jgi:hypothetical protein
MSTVAIKKIDSKLYRRVKALASLRGRTVGEAVNEALSVWIQLVSKGASIDTWLELEEESREDNKVFEEERQRLLRDHKGEYVAIANGRILGTFNAIKDAYQVIAKEKTKHGIVTRIEDSPTQIIDLGWSITEQFL